MRLRTRHLWIAPLLATSAAAWACHPSIDGRGPADHHGVIPIEVFVDKEPVVAGQEFTVQARVAPGFFHESVGCPVYAWVVEPPTEAGKRAKEELLKPLRGREKARGVRQRRDGHYYTTEGARFRLEPRHAGKRLRIQVRPSKGGQLARERTYDIYR